MIFSIIICTYNPNRYLLGRLLNAIYNFHESSPDFEVIIVDNNSSPSLEHSDEVASFINNKLNAYLIFENKPGLTAARIAGIKASKSDWIIFLDDDNEPHNSYLLACEDLIKKYPEVGAWGPGILLVKYFDQEETIFLKKIKWLFQERNFEGDNFDNNISEGSIYYPYGTGMVLRKDILIKYVEKVESGLYTMSDRLGKNLLSAGDTQILFTVIKSGFYAGSSSKLILSHLIERKKTSLAYAEKLVFALNSSHILAYNEVFPNKNEFTFSFSNFDIVKLFISTIRLFRLNKEKYTLRIFWAKKCGEINARVVAYNLNEPLLLKIYKILIR
jgi:glycosyltransferase involved in cell wall biosynthesis